MTDLQLIQAANESRRASYAPYSHFAVGAALLTADGRIFTGCNIENASFGGTVCAERVAIFKAVSEGVTAFSKIAIVGGAEDDPHPTEPCPPCGFCRQVMAEFCDKDLEILLWNGKDVIKYTLGELLPCSFSGEDLR